LSIFQFYGPCKASFDRECPNTPICPLFSSFCLSKGI
jgi:hypothetical protein